MVDLAIAVGIAIALLLAYAIIDRIVGPGRIIVFFITSHFTLWPHVPVFGFVLCAPLGILRHAPAYYAVMGASLWVAYAHSGRVVSVCSRHRRCWSVLCVISGLAAGVCTVAGHRALGISLLIVYTALFACIFRMETDFMDHRHDGQESSRDQTFGGNVGAVKMSRPRSDTKGE